MITQILYTAGVDLSAFIGGKLPCIGGNGRAGKSEVMVCESCEFVDTFLKLYPDIAVILNIDADHLDYFKTLENIIKSFRKFAQNATKALIINGDDANTLKAVDALTMNGKNVWYLLTQDGAMLAAGLVQDNTGNFYSLETEHNGYFGMLRYMDGYYNCSGQSVYLTFNREHNGSFGAVTNADGLEKLKQIYGITRYGIGNENSVYTVAF